MVFRENELRHLRLARLSGAHKRSFVKAAKPAQPGAALAEVDLQNHANKPRLDLRLIRGDKMCVRFRRKDENQTWPGQNSKVTASCHLILWDRMPYLGEVVNTEIIALEDAPKAYDWQRPTSTQH